jgi:hypothetical protein
MLICIIALSLPAYAKWEEAGKEVEIEKMGFTLTLPESWSVTPDEEGFKGFSKVDAKILCTPVLIEDDAQAMSIFIYATKRDDFASTVMDMGRARAEVESDVLEIGRDVASKVVDADGGEYPAMRNLNLINKKDLAYGVIFHRDEVRFEIYYTPWDPLEYGEHFAEFEEVLGSIKFTD